MYFFITLNLNVYKHGKWLATYWQVDYIRSTTETAEIYRHKNHTYSGYGFVFPVYNIFCQHL